MRIAAFAIVLLAAGPSHAKVLLADHVTRDTGVKLTPEQLTAQAGDVSFKVLCGESPGQTRVRAYTDSFSPEYRSDDVYGTILDLGLALAWRECVSGDYGAAEYDLGRFEFYARPEKVYPKLLFATDGYRQATGEWLPIYDVLGEANARRAERQARRDAATAAAQERAQAQKLEREQAERRAREAQLVAGLVTWSLRLSALLVLIFLGLNWRTFARWLYALTPHPVVHIIDRSIALGEPVDIEALKEHLALRPTNSIEAEVREAQLNKATERLMAHQAELAREFAELNSHAELRAEERARETRLYPFRSTEAALLKATLVHEVEAARTAALRERLQNG